MATRKLLNEYKHMLAQPDRDMGGAPFDSQVLQWSAYIYGYARLSRPENTDWEGGVFQLLFEFPANYPQKPPKVRFLTKVFHPNGTPR